MRKNIFALLALACLTLQAAGAAAEGGACRDDIKKFCAGVLPGGGRLAWCLHQHRGELSADCRQQAAEDLAKLLEVSAACFEDAKTLCAEVVPGGGRIAACLLQHSAEIKDEKCKHEVEEAKTGLQSLIPGVCAKDAKKFCSGIKPGEGRIKDCLASHKGERAPACRKKVERWDK